MARKDQGKRSDTSVSGGQRYSLRQAESRGPTEFSDRYRGPQQRLVTEAGRNAPTTSRRVSGRVAPPAVSKSEQQKERVTSPTLATQRVTLPSAATQARSQQPSESAARAPAQADRTVGQAERPRLRETFTRAPTTTLRIKKDEPMRARRRGAR